MDIKKYEVLLNVLDKGCFAKACEELGYTQPAITHMMKSMEREIGLPLLKRSNKGIRLTSEGREVLPLIRELVEANQRLTRHYDLLRGMETGTVRVGVFPTVSCAWMPQIVTQFEKQCPHICLELLEENSLSRLEEWLTSGFIDAAIFSRQPEHTFKWIPIKKDPLLAMIPEGHPLAENTCLKPLQFQDLPILMCKTKDGQDRDIRRYFAENGVPELTIRLSSNQDYAIAFMVQMGLGVAVLPELILHTLFPDKAPGFAVRHMDPPAYREIGMALRQGEEPSPAVDRFIKCIKFMADDLRQI